MNLKQLFIRIMNKPDLLSEHIKIYINHIKRIIFVHTFCI